MISNGYLQANNPLNADEEDLQRGKLGSIYRIFSKKNDDGQQTLVNFDVCRGKMLSRVIKLDNIKSYKIQEIL